MLLQNVRVVRVYLLHRTDGDLAGVASLLLHTALQIHTRQGQTLCEYLLICYENTLISYFYYCRFH